MNDFDDMKFDSYKKLRKSEKKNYSFTLSKDIIDFFIRENPNVPLSYLINEILKDVRDASGGKSE